MAGQLARLTFLRLIDGRGGDWTWYQFERAFPPGWFTDEAPDTRAMDIVNRLMAEGLVSATSAGPQPHYRLTERGASVLRESAIGSTSV